MSFFRVSTDTINEALVLGLMLVFIVVILYSGIDWTYKLGIGAVVFTMIFVSTVANQALRQLREQDRKRLKQ